MIKPRVKLPGQPSQKQQLLPPGTKVKLKNAPHGEEGVVEGSTRHKVVIRWPSLNFIGKYRPESLSVVGAVKQAEAVPAKVNPYQRLLQKLDAANARRPTS